jgi:hypothetical protein
MNWEELYTPYGVMGPECSKCMSRKTRILGLSQNKGGCGKIDITMRCDTCGHQWHRQYKSEEAHIVGVTGWDRKEDDIEIEISFLKNSNEAITKTAIRTSGYKWEASLEIRYVDTLGLWSSAYPPDLMTGFHPCQECGGLVRMNGICNQCGWRDGSGGEEQVVVNDK